MVKMAVVVLTKARGKGCGSDIRSEGCHRAEASFTGVIDLPTNTAFAARTVSAFS